MEIKLSQIRPGQRARLLDIPDSSPLKKRLKQFGLDSGMVVSCSFHSPKGHMVALQFGGTLLALRRADLMDVTACLC